MSVLPKRPKPLAHVTHAGHRVHPPVDAEPQLGVVVPGGPGSGVQGVPGREVSGRRRGAQSAGCKRQQDAAGPEMWHSEVDKNYSLFNISEPS